MKRIAAFVAALSLMAGSAMAWIECESRAVSNPYICSGDCTALLDSYTIGSTINDWTRYSVIEYATRFIGENTGICKIKILNMWKNGAPAGNVVIKIYSSTGTHPLALLASSNPIAASTLSNSSAGGITIDGMCVPIVDGSEYWLAISYSGSSDSSNYVRFIYDNAIATGKTVRSTDSGLTWNSEATVRSFKYEIYK